MTVYVSVHVHDVLIELENALPLVGSESAAMISTKSTVQVN